MSDTMNISPELLEKMNRYWEAANYLSAGQLYLLDNPLLREPLTMDHVKKKIVGHWGTDLVRTLSMFTLTESSRNMTLT